MFERSEDISGEGRVRGGLSLTRLASLADLSRERERLGSAA